jgi:hypothetical protein
MKFKKLFLVSISCNAYANVNTYRYTERTSDKHVTGEGTSSTKNALYYNCTAYYIRETKFSYVAGQEKWAGRCEATSDHADMTRHTTITVRS